MSFTCIWTSGFWVAKSNLPGGLSQFSDYQPVSASLEALVVNEFSKISFEDPRLGISVSGSDFLDTLQFNSSIESRLTVILVVYFTLLVLRYVSLKLSNRKKNFFLN